MLTQLQRDILPWIARTALSLMFIESAVDKLTHWSVYLEEVANMGIPFPPFALAAAVFVEVWGIVGLLTSITIIPALTALGVYTVSVNFFYFDFWAMEGRDAVMAGKEFLKNIAVAGGIIATVLMLKLRAE